MGVYDWDDPHTYEPDAVRKEVDRVFDICHGCRLCFNLCPSFPDLFDRIDRTPDESVSGLDRHDTKSVVDLCYQCKICYVRCPYTPPHRFMLDFPALIMRAKITETREKGIPLRDRMLGHVDALGALARPVAPLVNALNRSKPARFVLEKTAGIHREKLLPLYHSETFTAWFRKHRKKTPAIAGAARKVAFFASCSVDYNHPATGRAAVRVLEHNGVRVELPEQVCCGMPHLDSGNLEPFRDNARKNLATLTALVRDGFDVVSPGPTCSLLMKLEYPDFVPGADADLVAAHTFDLCEYLMGLHAKGEFDTGFRATPKKIAYHLPCHLRRQNIGYKSRDLLALTGAEVELIEECSAHDGTWAMRRENFDLSRKYSRKLMSRIEGAAPDVVVSDCPLAGLQIENFSGFAASHPVEVLARAYGLSDD